MKFIDFFSGIGGFHSGLEQAGMECVGWCEFDKFAQKKVNYQEPMCGHSDSHAKMLALPESSEASKEAQEVDCFLKSCGSLMKKKTINPSGLSLKMLRIYSLLTEDTDSTQFSVKWPKEGTLANGKFTTPKTTDSHKTGSVSTLLDILEKQVEESYFLSQEKTMQLLSKL